MPTHVYANNNEIASKASEGKSIAAFPDVCFSPPAPPVGPMPLPYPNTGEATNTDKGTSKVFIKDKMSGMGDDSHFSKSMGDESATQNFSKGMITSALQGKCYFGLWSMDVQMEGKGVPRHLDMVTHNHASMMGNTGPSNNVSMMSLFNGKLSKVTRGTVEHTARCEKIVKRMYWSYGDDCTEVFGKTRHYADLNLHIEVDGYKINDVISVKLQKEDGSTVCDNVKVFRFLIRFEGDSIITVKNIFGRRSLKNL